MFNNIFLQNTRYIPNKTILIDEKRREQWLVSNIFTIDGTKNAYVLLRYFGPSLGTSKVISGPFKIEIKFANV